MAQTQNGYSILSKLSLSLTTIKVAAASTKVRRGDTATVLLWVARQLHYAIEPCVTLYGYRDAATNRIYGGLPSSNHLSGTAFDYNGAKHPYEHTHPQGWTSGWGATDQARIADILRAARVVEWGNNLSLFPKGWRDPMHFAISRTASAAGVKAAAKRLRGGTVTVTERVNGRAAPRIDADVLHVRSKGYAITYEQVAYRGGRVWLKTKAGTWYAADFTTW